MMFNDFTKTNMVYHVVNINDLSLILKNGIKFNDKNSYRQKYLEFHKFIDNYKPSYYPSWVIRQKAIFASLNYKKNHHFHSHSIILGVKINQDRCFIANENLVNQIYEPFILKDDCEFKFMKEYIETIGINSIRDYWNTSLSFKENLKLRRDNLSNYDAEVLVFHEILPEDISPIALITDHKYIPYNNIKYVYSNKGEKMNENRETT